MLALAENLPTTAAFTEADVETLESAFLQQEQVDCPVVHHFGPGVYIREVVLPTGAYVIGHRHKASHVNIMLEGRITLFNQDGTRTELTAPQTFVGGAGRKIAYIHETVRWQNVYATDETDVETLEAQILDKSVVSEEFHKANRLMLAHSRNADHEDFAAAIAEYELDPGTVWSMSLDETDQIPLPHGSYKMLVTDSLIHGKGVFASDNIAQYELIAPARLGGKRTPAGRYTNHSAAPNAVMLMDTHGDIYLFASQSISGSKGGSVGQEITIDYRQALALSAGDS
jgi:quercetin dioxygenase-like cupin family protein